MLKGTKVLKSRGNSHNACMSKGTKVLKSRGNSHNACMSKGTKVLKSRENSHKVCMSITVSGESRDVHFKSTLSLFSYLLTICNAPFLLTFRIARFSVCVQQTTGSFARVTACFRYYSLPLFPL